MTVSGHTESELVALRDGERIAIRPIRPDDKDALLDGFERLSPESRYRRFLTPMQRLSPRLLRYLTEVDHHDHEALVAESPDASEPIGVARFIRTEDDPTRAEVAIAVVDHWQGRGVATELLRRLADRAEEEGIDCFTATCLADNAAVIELLEEVAPGTEVKNVDGLTEVEVSLRARDDGPLRAALRRAATGALAFRPAGMRGD